MKNITIILPVHRIEDSYRVMFENAVKSVEQFHNDVKLMIVCPLDVKSEFTNISDVLEVNIVTNNSKTDFCSQVNLGIEKCSAKILFFCALELNYFSN